MGCQNVESLKEIKVNNIKFFDKDLLLINDGTYRELEPELLLNNDQEKNKYSEDKLIQFSKDFDYFNICWYDSNHSNDCLTFKKAFQKVDVIRGFSIESIINFFKNYNKFEEFILICPGKNGKKLVPQIIDNKSIKAIIIYCLNPEYHKEWTMKYEKIKGIISKEDEILLMINKINQNYYFPEYNYGLRYDENEVIYLSIKFEEIDTKGYSEHLIKALERETRETSEEFNQFKNKYKKFCIKMINYYKYNKQEFIEILKISKSNFLIEVLEYKEKKLMPSEKEMNDFCLFLENLTFLNLYIIKCPFIIETLSYEEIETIISNKIDYGIIKERYGKSKIALDYLVNDIKNNKNILIDQSDKIKMLQEFLINYILKIYE